VFYGSYALFSASTYADSLLRLIAAVSGAGLSALGYEARVSGVIVTGQEFAFRVVRGCDGLEPVGFLWAAVFATPATLPKKCQFAAFGGAVLLLLNLLRVVSVALVDVHFPTVAEAVHWNAWPAAIILIVVVLWLCWVRRIRLVGDAIG